MTRQLCQTNGRNRLASCIRYSYLLFLLVFVIVCYSDEVRGSTIEVLYLSTDNSAPLSIEAEESFLKGASIFNQHIQSYTSSHEAIVLYIRKVQVSNYSTVVRDVLGETSETTMGILGPMREDLYLALVGSAEFRQSNLTLFGPIAGASPTRYFSPRALFIDAAVTEFLELILHQSDRVVLVVVSDGTGLYEESAQQLAGQLKRFPEARLVAVEIPINSTTMDLILSDPTSTLFVLGNPMSSHMNAFLTALLTKPALSSLVRDVALHHSLWPLTQHVVSQALSDHVPLALPPIKFDVAFLLTPGSPDRDLFTWATKYDFVNEDLVRRSSIAHGWYAAMLVYGTVLRYGSSDKSSFIKEMLARYSFFSSRDGQRKFGFSGSCSSGLLAQGFPCYCNEGHRQVEGVALLSMPSVGVGTAPTLVLDTATSTSPRSSTSLCYPDGIAQARPGEYAYDPALLDNENGKSPELTISVPTPVPSTGYTVWYNIALLVVAAVMFLLLVIQIGVRCCCKRDCCDGTRQAGRGGSVLERIPIGSVMTFICIDVEHGAELWCDHPTEMREAAGKYHHVVNKLLRKYACLCVEKCGERVMVACPKVRAGLHCAMELMMNVEACTASPVFAAFYEAKARELWPQYASSVHHRTSEQGLGVKIGMHTGYVGYPLRSYDFGWSPSRSVMQLAWETQEIAHGGQIIVTAGTFFALSQNERRQLRLKERHSRRYRSSLNPVPVFEFIFREMRGAEEAGEYALPQVLPLRPLAPLSSAVARERRQREENIHDDVRAFLSVLYSAYPKERKLDVLAQMSRHHLVSPSPESSPPDKNMQSWDICTPLITSLTSRISCIVFVLRCRQHGIALPYDEAHPIPAEIRQPLQLRLKDVDVEAPIGDALPPLVKKEKLSTRAENLVIANPFTTPANAPVVFAQNAYELQEGDEVGSCFADGMLFRIINSKTGVWSYYNDTRDSLMTAYITLQSGAEVQWLANVQLSLNEEASLWTARIAVPPLTTVKVLRDAAGLGYHASYTRTMMTAPRAAQFNPPHSV